MLEQLEISDYRSCIDTSIALQPDLSVLIGPNGSGKTNILNALVLLRSLTTEREFGFRESDEPANECQLKATFRIDDKKTILTAKLQILTDAENTDAILSSKQSWYAKDFTGNTKRITVPLWVARHFLMASRAHGVLVDDPFLRVTFHGAENRVPESFQHALATITRFLRDIKYYSASQFTNPSLCPVSFEVEQEGTRRRGVRLRGHTRFLYDLYGARESASFESYFNVVGPNGIGLIDRIEFKEIPTSSVDVTVRSGGRIQKQKREKLLVVPQFSIGRNELSPSQLSEGTFKTLTLLFYVMTEKSSALLVEEPEVCVHHGLLGSIVELIKTYSKQKQIIVTTHSDFVLDQVEPRNVYQVARAPDSGTKVSEIAKAMSAQEFSALKEYLKTEGNLGEYWRHGGFE